MSSQLPLTLAARPDPTYFLTSHRGSVLIKAREVAVSSLGRVPEHMASFAPDNDRSPGKLAGAWLVRRDGKPLGRISHDGKLLAVDPEGRATGRQYRDPTIPQRKYRHLGQIVEGGGAGDKGPHASRGKGRP